MLLIRTGDRGANDPSWDAGQYPLDPNGHWGTRLDYSQFGSFDSPPNGSSIFATYSLTLNPTDPLQAPVTYDFLDLSLAADGSVSINTDLNGNDASLFNSLFSGLNGVLQINGMDVTKAQAEGYLMSFYSPTTGWNLNPNGYTFENFNGDDPTQTASVFSIAPVAFFDASTASITFSSIDGSEAIANAVPEPASDLLAGAGIVCCCLVIARRAFRSARLKKRITTPGLLSGSAKRF